MKRSDFFYIWVAITSYLTGPLVYSVSLWLIYGENTRDMGRLVTWTMPYTFIVKLKDRAMKNNFKNSDKVIVKGVVSSRDDKEMQYNWKLYKGEIVK